jgi:signal transduction histidine kinase
MSLLTKRFQVLAFLICVALVTLVSSFFLSLEAGDEARRRFAGLVRVSDWHSSQLHTETLRLIGTLDRYILGDESLERNDIMFRYEILWSRFSAVLDDKKTLYIWSQGDEVLQGLFQNLKSLEPVISGVSRGDQEVNGYARAVLLDLEAELRKYFQTVVTGEALEAIWLQDLKATNLRNELYILGILTSSLLLAGLVFYELSRSRAHARREQEARVAAEEAQRNAEQARVAAELANRAKAEFLATMSHELRTPLNAIIGFSEAMAQGILGELDYAGRDYAGEIAIAGRHLLSIINDLLDLAKVDAGHLSLEETTMDCESILIACVLMVSDRASRRDIKIKIELPQGNIAIFGDQIRLKQAVINLLSNAVKFSLENSTVRILARLGETGGVTISIEDEGIGMSPEEVSVAMQRFRQVSRGLKRAHEGTGLGLPIVEALVKLHGGELRIFSSPGVGTTAIIELPSSRTRPSQKLATPSQNTTVQSI